MRRSKVRKPFSEMTRREQINEAHEAIGRLERDINTGGWTRNLGDALARWQTTLARLAGAAKEDFTCGGWFDL